MKKINNLFKFCLILFLLSFGLFLTSILPKAYSAAPGDDKMPQPIPCYVPNTNQIIAYGADCPADGVHCIPNPCDSIQIPNHPGF